MFSLLVQFFIAYIAILLPNNVYIRSTPPLIEVQQSGFQPALNVSTFDAVVSSFDHGKYAGVDVEFDFEFDSSFSFGNGDSKDLTETDNGYQFGFTSATKLFNPHDVTCNINETYMSSNVSHIHHTPMLINGDVEPVVVMITDALFVIDEDSFMIGGDTLMIDFDTHIETRTDTTALTLYVNREERWGKGMLQLQYIICPYTFFYNKQPRFGLVLMLL